jgi:glycosyltransferase involved in cell wall biosynthesis
MRFYSVIIPVYNRPDEVDELLSSLCHQTFTNFEVIIVEDGSSQKCEEVVQSFSAKLNVRYYFKENTGQGFSRNYGFGLAKGDFYIVFDSDCLIPNNYFEVVEQHLDRQYLDAFGGPDRAHPQFTQLQKAISYSMTSLFTTGGTRGNKKHAGTFHPRSFNMGISKAVFNKTKGYRITRMGEDIEFSIRIIKAGFMTGLIPDAFVYHKRRTSFSHFYKQLHFFGRARVNVNRLYPGELKLVHLLPTIFVLGLVSLSIIGFLIPWLFQVGLGMFLVYTLAIFLDATIQSKSLKIGFLSVATAFTQLIGYGMGMITEVLSPRGNQPFSQK